MQIRLYATLRQIAGTRELETPVEVDQAIGDMLRTFGSLPSVRHLRCYHETCMSLRAPQGRGNLKCVRRWGLHRLRTQ